MGIRSLVGCGFGVLLLLLLVCCTLCMCVDMLLVAVKKGLDSTCFRVLLSIAKFIGT
jgi:hypothetical protein